MHRAIISRVIGRTCRKFRESDYPIASGEEVRKNGGKKEERFIPEEKYNFYDAVGWTTGLVLAYEFTYGRKRGFTTIEERNRKPAFSPFAIFERSNCPFQWPKTAVTQPVLTQSVVEIGNYHQTQKQSTSIDLTPFITEERSDIASLELTHGGKDNEETVYFTRKHEKSFTSHLYNDQTLTTKKSEDELPKPSVAETLAGDLLSALGAFKFLTNESKGIKPLLAGDHLKDYEKDVSPENPPMTALELMERGAELGSARALYNIGVAYDRMKDNHLAKQYYRRAADLGHPLASYNYAVFLLREGKIGQGLSLMRVAEAGGVVEAQKFLSKRSMNTVTVSNL